MAEDGKMAPRIGLGLVDRVPRLKDYFIRQASGLTGGTPRLLAGEAI